jgi:hypothetical protein
MRTKNLFALTATLVCIVAAADENVDHLVPEAGAFADFSHDYEAKVRSALVDRVAGRADFLVVVCPSFETEWMLSGDSTLAQLTLTRAAEKINRAAGRDVLLNTSTKTLSESLMHRLRALIVAHLANTRPEADDVDAAKAGPRKVTQIVVRADGVTYHFVARAIDSTATLSGRMWSPSESKRPALTALERAVISVADVVTAKSEDADRAMVVFQRALREAEQELRILHR